SSWTMLPPPTSTLFPYTTLFRSHLRPLRRLDLDPLPGALPAHLLVHPAFQEGLGGLPEVEVRVKLAAQAFDIEQRLLQQHKLRRSEEHTSELQSRRDLVCRLLLE